MTNKPLLISDCDEVLLHMAVPFQQWLDQDMDVHLDLESGTFVDALRHKHDGTVVEQGKVWDLLNGFFDSEMHRQQAIDGAVESINRIAEFADVAILTNLMDHRNAERTEQLRAVGIDFPVYTNQGGKGELMREILEKYQPSAAVFVDDLGTQHSSLAQHTPEVWRLHFVGEPILSKHIKTSPDAHARHDRWADAEKWITQKLLSGEAAPPIEKETA